MRKIKFKAWDKKKKEWYKPIHNACNGELFEIFLNFKGDYNIRLLDSFFHESHELYMGRFVIVQYTGLKDKNGKEIYESDILKFMSKSFLDTEFKENILPIWWDEENLCYKVGMKDKNFQPDRETDDGQFEIVGNVFEDDYLLKEKLENEREK